MGKEKIKQVLGMHKIYSILVLFIFFGCNPIKQIVKDKNKFDEIAKMVVESGLYCANDTIIQTKSDTLITYDTFYQRGADIIRDLFHTDTLRIPLTKKIVKTIRIRDTINSVVVDNARIKLLEAKLATQTEKTEEYKAKANSRLKWLILLIIAILVRIFYKPLKNLLLWHFLPMHK